MGKIEKKMAFTGKQLQMFLGKSGFSHIFLAHCSFVPVAIETIMQKKKKMEKENT